MRFGFIRTELQIKTLTLFVLEKALRPLEFDELTDFVMCDDAIDYFVYAEGVQYLVDTEHIQLFDNKYTILPKGKRNLEICLNEIPGSIRNRVVENIQEEDLMRQRAEKANCQMIRDTDNKMWIQCSFSDEFGEIISFKLNVLSEETGKKLMDNFKKRPEIIVKNLLKDLEELR